jgi:hypothetical protein
VLGVGQGICMLSYPTCRGYAPTVTGSNCKGGQVCHKLAAQLMANLHWICQWLLSPQPAPFLSIHEQLRCVPVPPPQSLRAACCSAQQCDHAALSQPCQQQLQAVTTTTGRHQKTKCHGLRRQAL